MPEDDAVRHARERASARLYEAAQQYATAAAAIGLQHATLGLLRAQRAALEEAALAYAAALGWQAPARESPP
jgi:hypothetical protein